MSKITKAELQEENDRLKCRVAKLERQISDLQALDGVWCYHGKQYIATLKPEMTFELGEKA